MVWTVTVTPEEGANKIISLPNGRTVASGDGATEVTLTEEQYYRLDPDLVDEGGILSNPTEGA